MNELNQDLNIPVEAADLWFVCGCSEKGIRSGYEPDAIPIIVAAELQRIADEHRETNDGGDVVSALDERARELEGGGW